MTTLVDFLNHCGVMVAARPGPEVTVVGWLERTMGPDSSVWNASHDEIQLYRLRWMNSMIEEFSA